MDAVELLNSVKEDLGFYNDSIKEIAKEMLEQEISEYPIFIITDVEVTIGEPILNKDDFNREWSVQVSHMEEFTEKGIITEDKLEKFKSIYKDPTQFICVFLISEKGGNFIFHPYK